MLIEFLSRHPGLKRILNFVIAIILLLIVISLIRHTDLSVPGHRAQRGFVVFPTAKSPQGLETQLHKTSRFFLPRLVICSQIPYHGGDEVLSVDCDRSILPL